VSTCVCDQVNRIFFEKLVFTFVYYVGSDPHSKGIGPKTALKLIREHKNIETILKHVDSKKYGIPESWIPNENSTKNNDSSEEEDENGHPNNADEKEEAIPAYVQARRLFLDHEVMEKDECASQLKWKPCQKEALSKFLVEDMCFNPERVANNIEKLEKAYKANAKPQSRMDSFFKPVPQDPAKVVEKRKRMKEKSKADAKKAKSATKKKH